MARVRRYACRRSFAFQGRRCSSSASAAPSSCCPRRNPGRHWLRASPSFRRTSWRVASLDSDAAVSYGRVRAWLEARGTPIGPLDTLIGAHAAALDVILVTHNTREFRRIDTLRVEDWTSP